MFIMCGIHVCVHVRVLYTSCHSWLSLSILPGPCCVHNVRHSCVLTVRVLYSVLYIQVAELVSAARTQGLAVSITCSIHVCYAVYCAHLVTGG